MPIDPSIALGIRPVQPVPLADPLEQYAKVMSIKGLMGQQNLQDLHTQKATQDLADEKSYREASMESGGDLTKLRDLLYSRGAPHQALAVEQARLKAETERAGLDKTKGEVRAQRLKEYRDAFGSVQTAEDARSQTIAEHNDPILGPALAEHGVTLEQSLAKIPTDPQQLQQYIAQKTMGMEKYIEMNKPQVHVQNLGGTSNVISTPGLGGAPTTLSSTPITVSPDAALHNATLVRGQNMSDSRQRELNGIMEGQNVDVTPETVKSIANYDVKLPPPPVNARNPMLMMRYNKLLADVKKENPKYNSADFEANNKAVKDFATGVYGQKTESSNTAVNHLDTLKKLALAQKNGNIQLFNKIANEYAEQTGGTAPTNLKAAITMAAPEVVKAVSGAGGGVEDRNKAAAAMNPNYSPDQALGAIGTMQELFAGRLSETERTYNRTTRRTDFRDKMLSPAAKELLESRGGKREIPAAASAPTKDDIDAELRKRGVIK